MRWGYGWEGQMGPGEPKGGRRLLRTCLGEQSGGWSMLRLHVPSAYSIVSLDLAYEIQNQI